MKLTNEQREAVRSASHTLLVACPGSGKTRTIVAKLLRCIEEVRDTARRVACITYTNAAVDEIDERLRLYGGMDDEQYCEVSTIHTFCLNNILRCFYWRFKPYRNGFKILPSDSELYLQLAQEALNEHDISSVSVEAFENLNRLPDGTPISEELPPAAARTFWKKLQDRGLIDFTNIVYFSYRVLDHVPTVAHALACKFSWVLVDEFQDTSSLQTEILKRIADRGKTKFFLVGDPLQSIYSFAGARPELMDEFAVHLNARTDCKLLGNFRSSTPIIMHAERAIRRDPQMYACGDAVKFQEEPQYQPVSAPFEAITDYFIPTVDSLGIDYGKCAILAPSWFSLYRLGTMLRDYGVPVFGIGARPYKRHHLFGFIAEQICSYIDAPRPEKIPAIEKALFVMLAQATGRTDYHVFSYRGRVVIFRLINEAVRLRGLHYSGIGWLQSAAPSFENILHESELLPTSCMGLLPQSVTDMYDDMVKRKVDVQNLTVADLGLFANPAHNVKLLTIHQAKGREFDAVAIIDLHENRLPSRYANTPAKLNESLRAFYVAITRAARILIYVTDTSHHKNTPSRFLAKVLQN